MLSVNCFIYIKKLNSFKIFNNKIMSLYLMHIYLKFYFIILVYGFKKQVEYKEK